MWKPAFQRARYPSYQNFFSCDGAKPHSLSLLFAVVGSPWRLTSREPALGSPLEPRFRLRNDVFSLGSLLRVGTNFRKRSFSQAGQSKACCLRLAGSKLSCGKRTRMLKHTPSCGGAVWDLTFQFRPKPWAFVQRHLLRRLL